MVIEDVRAEALHTVHMSVGQQPAAGVDAGAKLPIADADGLSWVGFTASTGLASMDVDLLSFAFEQHPE